MGDSKELSSIVKEPSFLKGDKPSRIVGGFQEINQAKIHQEEFLAELVNKKKSINLHTLQKLAENKKKSFFFNCKELLRFKKKKNC